MKGITDTCPYPEGQSVMGAETGRQGCAEGQNMGIMSEYFPQMLTKCKGEDGDLTGEKSARRPPEWEIKVKVTRGGTGQHGGVPS